MDADAARIGEALAERIRKAGYNEALFARHVGISQSTLHRVTSGKQFPSIPVTLAIAKHFKVSTSEILFPDGEPWAFDRKMPDDELMLLNDYRERREEGLTITMVIRMFAYWAVERMFDEIKAKREAAAESNAA